MQRSARILSAAVAAALTVGVAGPTVSAQAATPSHAKHAKVIHVKVAKSAKAAAKDKRLVLKDIAHLNALLGKFATSVRTSKVGAERKAALLANVAGDRAALTELAQIIKDADATVSDLKQVRRDLKAYRVSNYQSAVNLLRYADALAAKIDALRAEVVEGSLEAMTLDEAGGKVAEAIEAAYAITATSGKAAVTEVRVLLSGANTAVEAVEDALAAEEADPEVPTSEDSTQDSTVEPTEDPTTEDPTIDDPTVPTP